jgi:hypothetical protein
MVGLDIFFLVSYTLIESWGVYYFFTLLNFIVRLTTLQPASAVIA